MLVFYLHEVSTSHTVRIKHAAIFPNNKNEGASPILRINSRILKRKEIYFRAWIGVDGFIDMNTKAFKN